MFFTIMPNASTVLVIIKQNLAQSMFQNQETDRRSDKNWTTLIRPPFPLEDQPSVVTDAEKVDAVFLRKCQIAVKSAPAER